MFFASLTLVASCHITVSKDRYPLRNVDLHAKRPLGKTSFVSMPFPPHPHPLPSSNQICSLLHVLLLSLTAWSVVRSLGDCPTDSRYGQPNCFSRAEYASAGWTSLQFYSDSSPCYPGPSSYGGAPVSRHISPTGQQPSRLYIGTRKGGCVCVSGRVVRSNGRSSF